MAVDANQVLQDLKKGQYAPVYFLHGEEAFYIDQISDYIEEKALDESQKGFNQVICYGKDVDVATILGHARRFPMMSDKQVVIVKEAQGVKDLTKDPGEKMLLQYLDNPTPSTILVFAHKNKKIDGRKALGKAMGKKAILVETKKLYDNQVPAWIQGYVSGKSNKISQKASSMLQESVGNELGKLANEIDKVLINFDKSNVEITEDHIEKFVGISKEYNVFELQKSVQNKEILKTNRIIMHLGLDPKAKNSLQVIPILYGFFIKVLQIHYAPDKSDRAIASLLKVNPFFAKDYLVGARNYPLQKIPVIIGAFHLADLQAKGIKGNAIKDGEILKELLFKVLHY